MANNPPARNVVDWDAMEPDWRAGIKTKKQLSEEYRVSRAAIDKHWDKAGVERDLKVKIQAKADALVAQSVVTPEVTPAQKNATKAAETAIIDANAAVQAHVRIAHRSDIKLARTLSMTLLAELEHQTGSNALYLQLQELLEGSSGEESNATAADRQRKRQDIFERAMSLGGRSKTMKEMADTLKTLVGLEREAHGLEIASGDDGMVRGFVSYQANIPRRNE